MRHSPEDFSVLVVDDEVDTATSLADLLSIYGYRSQYAFCADEALEKAKANPPDAVILDLQMPGMDGWKLASHLRQASKPPLLLAVTGLASEADIKASSVAGIHLHLVKPIAPEILLRILRRFELTLSQPCITRIEAGHSSI